MMTTETVEAVLEHDGPNGNGNDNTSPLSGLKGILEAILFVSGEPLSVDRMLGVVEGVARDELMSALRALQADYSAEGRGLQLVPGARGVQIATRPDFPPWIERVERAKEGARLSLPAPRTLSTVP